VSFTFNYICGFSKKFETAPSGYSGGNWFVQKNRSWKSRVRHPLSLEIAAAYWSSINHLLFSGRHTGILRKRDNLLRGERGDRGGRGANSYDRKKALFSIGTSFSSLWFRVWRNPKINSAENKQGWILLSSKGKNHVTKRHGRGWCKDYVQLIHCACLPKGRFSVRFSAGYLRGRECFYIFIEDQAFLRTYHSATCPLPSSFSRDQVDFLPRSSCMCVAGRAY